MHLILLSCFSIHCALENITPDNFHINMATSEWSESSIHASNCMNVRAKKRLSGIQQLPWNYYYIHGCRPPHRSETFRPHNKNFLIHPEISSSLTLDLLRKLVSLSDLQHRRCYIKFFCLTLLMAFYVVTNTLCHHSFALLDLPDLSGVARGC